MKMVDGWKPVVIPEEIYDKVKKHYDTNKEALKLREGGRSLTGFFNYAIRECLKEKGVI